MNDVITTPEEMTAALDAAATEKIAATAEIVSAEDALNQAIDIGRSIDATSRELVAQQFDFTKIIGQIQAVGLFKKFAVTADAMLFKQVKETKAYRGMQVPDQDGSIKTLKSFEQFCEYMGVSRSKADEDIANLNILGEAFMESAQKMGLGYKDLRKLRALPEADRQAVIAAEDAGPEELKDMIAELAASKARAEEELKEAQASMSAKDKVLASKNKTLDAVQTELAKLKTLPPDEQQALQFEREAWALETLHKTGLELLGQFAKYLNLVQRLSSTEQVSRHTKEKAVALTSGMCSQIADELLEAGIDIDFRYLTYPAELGAIPLRGDAPDLISAEGE